MSLHLVKYVFHVRRELNRALEGLSEADLDKRVAGINSCAWIVAHLAWQEQRYWLEPRGLPQVADLSAYRNGATLTNPNFAEVYPLWQEIIRQSESWLEGLAEDDLRNHFRGNKFFELENIGSLMTRVIGHYYLHIGQITAIRKILGYEVPGFVGSQEGAYYE
ncbi:MAG: DinB family protein [Trueperaceae bacterium]|nr:DinB family protein [Trueperaceae bacterium]